MNGSTLLICLAVGLYLMAGLYLLGRKGSGPAARLANTVLVVAILGIIAVGLVIGIEAIA